MRTTAVKGFFLALMIFFVGCKDGFKAKSTTKTFDGPVFDAAYEKELREKMAKLGEQKAEHDAISKERKDIQQALGYETGLVINSKLNEALKQAIDEEIQISLEILYEREILLNEIAKARKDSPGEDKQLKELRERKLNLLEEEAKEVSKFDIKKFEMLQEYIIDELNENRRRIDEVEAEKEALMSTGTDSFSQEEKLLRLEAEITRLEIEEERLRKQFVFVDSLYGLSQDN